MPGHRSREPQPRPTILIVCDDDDTLIRLRHYLSRAGLQARATRRLDDAWRQAASCTSVVVMPDEFDSGEVADGLQRLLSRSPPPFVIIVTSARQYLEPLLGKSGQPDSVVIIPRPVWVWTIVDLLRSKAGTPLG